MKRYPSGAFPGITGFYRRQQEFNRFCSRISAPTVASHLREERTERDKLLFFYSGR